VFSLFKSKKKQQNKVYTSLDDLSIWHWDKANSTGDLKYIVKKGKPEKETLLDAWEMLNNEHLDLYGISDNYQKILAKKKELCKHQINFIKTGDRVALNFIKLCKNEIKNLESDNDSSPNNINNVIAVLDKEFGRDIDPKKTSVVKFHSYINLINKNNERQD
jgi:hypothetical protein